MNEPAAPPSLQDDGWTRRERAVLIGLILLLVALFVFRGTTRRPDSSRIPAHPDILVLHAAELRVDAASSAALATDLGLDPERTLYWTQAFAQSNDPLRSALSALRGSLVLNLEASPGPRSLAPRLTAAGWSTQLVGPQALLAAASEGFTSTRPVASRTEVPDALDLASSGPRFAFVQLAAAGPPLHADTTDAPALRAGHAARTEELRGILARTAQAFSRSRPQLIVLLGASGAELGEHPESPDLLHDSQLRVPFVMGLRGGDGLPWGRHDTLVQSADLGPTLLDFVDLRPRAERDADGVERDGVSLEPLVHGWVAAPVHEQIVSVGPGVASVRSRDWKLIVPVDAPWRLRSAGARLHALAEDPGERTNLAVGRELGPIGQSLLEQLQTRLNRPPKAAP